MLSLTVCTAERKIYKTNFGGIIIEKNIRTVCETVLVRRRYEKILSTYQMFFHLIGSLYPGIMNG
jgi:hypothetical protein